MGQSPSSSRNKSVRRSLRSFSRWNKLNKSSLSHTFNMQPSEDYLELMNVNTATEEQLMTLPGVNRQLARSIVRHRQMIGRFKRVDDLALVSGIGADKLELLRPEICVNSKKALSRASSCTQSLDSVRTNVESKLCSINSSSVFQLQCVPGLNQEIAANIVDYRNKKGPFKSLDDLIKVRGMNILRLSTVKNHLSLELRKCESVQHLNNGHVNGWTEPSPNGSISNGVTSTPKSVHRKSLSMPTKFQLTLPNGFANAPVNDILDLLSAYSHRPIVEEDFRYERDGVKCCRIASWNLHQLSKDKIMNPGVREVVCRTILENKLSIIAIQDVLNEEALKMLCEELNTPTLRRVREWKSNSHRWEYCLPVDSNSSRKLGFVYDSMNKGIITIEDIELGQVSLLAAGDDVRRLVERLAALRGERLDAAAQAFVVGEQLMILVNVHCRGQLDDDDRASWCQLSELAATTPIQTAVVGEFGSWDNVRALSSYQPLLDAELTTTVDPTATGRSAILCPGTIEKTNFNGHFGAIKSGLSHLAIPRGWSWGGPASPYCPVWVEIKIPD